MGQAQGGIAVHFHWRVGRAKEVLAVEKAGDGHTGVRVGEVGGDGEVLQLDVDNVVEHQGKHEKGLALGQVEGQVGDLEQRRSSRQLTGGGRGLQVCVGSQQKRLRRVGQQTRRGQVAGGVQVGHQHAVLGVVDVL